MSGIKWRLIGSFRGDRVVAIAGVPGDSTTFYFGAVSGGIWKTTDAGTTAPWQGEWEAQRKAIEEKLAASKMNDG